MQTPPDLGVFKLGRVVKDSLRNGWRGRRRGGGAAIQMGGVTWSQQERAPYGTVRVSAHERSSQPAQQMTLADLSSAHRWMKGR